MTLRLQPIHSSLYTPSFSRSSHSSAALSIPKKRKAPPYPYGAAQQYKQRDHGLYGGSKIQHGNNVSEKTETKTLRVWRPNIHNKRLWSDALGEFVRLKVQARVLRTIDKVGGLDEYLLGEKAARIKELGVTGWQLRWRIMQTKRVKERVQRENRLLGLPSAGYLKQQEKEKKLLRQQAENLALKCVRMEQDHPEEVNEEEAALADMNDPDVTPSLSASLALEARVDQVALDIAQDTRTASPNLPMPPLEPDMSEEAQQEQTLQTIPAEHENEDPDQKGLSNYGDRYFSRRSKLDHLATQLNLDNDDLLSQAEETLMKREAAEEQQSRKQKRREEIRRYRAHNAPIPPAEPHPEIDYAIEKGTAWQLYEKYRPEAQLELMKLRKDREAERVIKANRYLWLMKTSRRKGGTPGVYRKKSGWDTAYKRAGKEVAPRSNIFNVPPPEITKSQWKRLIKHAVKQRDAAGGPSNLPPVDGGEGEKRLGWFASVRQRLSAFFEVRRQRKAEMAARDNAVSLA